MSHVLVLTGPGVADVAARVGRAVGAAPLALGPQACELASDNLAAAREAVGDAPVDLNRVALAGRAKSVLVADMDGTIIQGECIDRIADLAGVGAEVAAITERAMAGELDFAQALRARVALLAGLAVADLARVAMDPMPGAGVLVATMAARGAVTALVSGGFTLFTGPVAAGLGFAHTRANVLEVADGRLTGRLVGPILDAGAKAAALADFCGAAGPGAALAVGDGANDREMVCAAGLGVAFRARPVLEAVAGAVIRHGDLTALLALQGIAADEWSRSRDWQGS